jgi:hypothetical protein
MEDIVKSRRFVLGDNRDMDTRKSVALEMDSENHCWELRRETKAGAHLKNVNTQRPEAWETLGAEKQRLANHTGK